VWALVVLMIFLPLLMVIPATAGQPGPNVPPVNPPPVVFPKRVELRCDAGERTCRFRIDGEGGVVGNNSIDILIRRVGRLPARPPRVVRVPGPVRTRTITPPRRTVTIRPAPRTVRVTTESGGGSSSETVTRRRVVRVPGPTNTVTVGPPQTTATTITRPRVTITAENPLPPRITVTSSPTGQAPSPRATITETPESAPTKKLSVAVTIPQAVGISVLGILILMAIVLAGMYAGYALGFKESDDQSVEFLTFLRDKLR